MKGRDCIVLRADASETIGAGHAMRLLALAEAMHRRGGDARFLLGGAPEFVASKLRKRGFVVDLFLGEIGSVADQQALCRLADSVDASAVVVDGYHFDSRYLAAVQQCYPTVVMDDLGGSSLPVDLVVNSDYGAEKLAYSTSGSPQLLLGSSYALLRSEFIRRARTLDSAPSPLGLAKVLITFGGSDPANASVRVLHSLIDREPLHIHVVLGGGYQHRLELSGVVQLAEERGHIVELISNPSDMATCLAWADMVISAAGGTLWELSYLGLAVAAYSVVDNQDPVATSLRDKNMIFAGQRLDTLSDSALRASLSGMFDDAEERVRRANRFSALIDGCGAERVLDAICALPSQSRLQQAG